MSTKIGALVVDLLGLELTQEEKELIQHPLVGGIILFSRNYSNPDQLQQLCKSIRAHRRQQQPILIMVDQEGGRVQRFRDGFYPLPGLASIGDYYDHQISLALELAKAHAWLMATEMLGAGIDVSLAPVVDLNKGICTAIGTRAFHAHPEAVFRLAQTYCHGMHSAGMPSVLKHFPGHGSVSADSHAETPVDERSLEVIMQDDIVPFSRLIQHGANAVMAAHIVFPAVDAMQVGFSRKWLQTILRDQLQFNGVTLSDDLNMQGAGTISDYADRVVAAREAGCDIALLCNNRQGVIRVLDQVKHEAHQLPESKWRLLQGQPQFFADIQDRLQQTKSFLRLHTVNEHVA